MKRLFALPFALLALLPSQALAYDWIANGRVVSIEASYVPSSIPFRLDVGGGACPPGSPLSWSGRGATAAEQQQSVQAILAVLMTAQATGRSVQVYGNNSGCTIDYIYLM